MSGVSRNVVSAIVTVGASAVSLYSLLSSLVPNVGSSGRAWRVALTNTHATQNIFAAMFSTVSSSDYNIKLLPGTNDGGLTGSVWAVPIDQLYLIGSGAGTTVRVSLFDWSE